VAFVAGIVIAKTTAFILDKKESHLASPIEIVQQEVFVLKQDASKGTELFPSDFIITRRPQKTIPQGAVCFYDQISGRSLNQTVKKGSVLVEEYFVPAFDESTSLGYIPLGYQSVPIHIFCSDIENNSDIQNIFQGDKVDVIAVSPIKDGENTQNEKIIFENISVLKTNWANKDISLIREKASLLLLLSHKQKQDLLKLTDANDVKIRIRICPPLKSVRNNNLPSFESETPQPAVASSIMSNNLADTFPQTFFPQYTNGGEISLSFKKNNGVEKMLQNSIDTTLTIPASLNKLKPLGNESATKTHSSVQTSSPKYISFYDAVNHSYAKTQWQVVNPSQSIFHESQQEKRQMSSSYYPALKPHGAYYQQGQSIAIE
jgi:hypothetical protein